MKCQPCAIARENPHHTMHAITCPYCTARMLVRLEQWAQEMPHRADEFRQRWKAAIRRWADEGGDPAKVKAMAKKGQLTEPPGPQPTPNGKR